MAWTLPEEFATVGGTIRWAWIDNQATSCRRTRPHSC